MRYQRKTRSKYFKTKKMQGCNLKAVGAIFKVTKVLQKLKNNKNLNTTTLSKNISTMVHDCTGSLALLSHVNTDLKQNKRDHITYCLDNQYHALRKNVPADSEFFYCDDLAKRIVNVIVNKKLFPTSKTSFQSYNSCFKSSKNLYRFPQNPGNHKQNGYHNRTGQLSFRKM